MSVISTNINAMFAQNTLTSNGRAQSTSMQQLSTGSRVNSARDDAAGLAIGQNMTSQIRGLNQSVKNANDGISMLQTADGALATQSDMLQRMNELAVQSATGTNSDVQRGYLNTEFQALAVQIDKISTDTLWNGKAILTGAAGDVASTGVVADPKDTFTLQTGLGSGNTTTVKISAMGKANLGLVESDTMGIAGTPAVALTKKPVTIDIQANARAAIKIVGDAIGMVNTQRANIGAVSNQLTYAADNMTNISSNVNASRSQIMDTDYAQATTQLAKTQIIAQAATAMLAQANQQPQSVLALLK